jgi:hypothetical protein
MLGKPMKCNVCLTDEIQYFAMICLKIEIVKKHKKFVKNDMQTLQYVSSNILNIFGIVQK